MSKPLQAEFAAEANWRRDSF